LQNPLITVDSATAFRFTPLARNDKDAVILRVTSLPRDRLTKAAQSNAQGDAAIQSGLYHCAPSIFSITEYECLYFVFCDINLLDK
jgi:hypothetical protein